MGSGAVEMVFQCIFDASLSNFENMERKPYHRNCSCALHNLKGTGSRTYCNHKNIVSFPKKKSLHQHSICTNNNVSFPNKLGQAKE
ncbi:hypothetical protein A4A49_04705 [Nicotiana attenuata]|uniref:Uncharacterized protein n=1 Tax=Nicotiana attenuata TaxID=49451 RepID=A0A314L2R6_NICAT|nr:hypothetical protein A4A49_04705 [Nicotiana attenuata]